MATANSQPFTITSTPLTLSGAGITNIQQQTATISVATNSAGGLIYAAIRTDRAWTTGDAAVIIGGIGDWAGTIDPIQIGVNRIDATGLNVSQQQFVGIVQSDGTNESVVEILDFTTTSYPAGDLAPYQLQAYPDRVNYEHVPVHADLSYGWGGNEPRTFTATGLPAGLQMNSSGQITGSEPAVVDSSTTRVTVQNNSGVVTSSFSWQIYSHASAPGQAPLEGLTRKELVDSALAFADRYTDAEVIANMGVIFKLAEDRMSRVMRNREMSKRVVYPVVEGQEYYALPTDYAGVRDLFYRDEGGSSVTFEFLSPMQITKRSNYPGGRYYAIKGGEIQILNNLASGQIELMYYQRVPPLVADGDKNWLTAAHSDIYMTALLAQIEAFAKNDDRARMFDDVLSRAFDEIADRAVKDTWSGTPLQIRIA